MTAIIDSNGSFLCALNIVELQISSISSTSMSIEGFRSHGSLVPFAGMMPTSSMLEN